MFKIILRLMFLITLFISMPAMALSFFCDTGSKEPRPDWVSKMGLNLAGQYVAVGSAEKDGRNSQQHFNAATNNARAALVQQIEVTIKAENKQSTRVSNNGVQQDVLNEITVSAEEVLRGVETKFAWIDPDSCIQYVLVAVKKDSVAQAKREKSMRQRLAKIKTLYADGSDRIKYRDIKIRQKFLEDAQSLLIETDFNLLPEELNKEIYSGRIKDALALIAKESSLATGRMALVAVNQGGSIRSEVIGKMLDYLRSTEKSADRLMAECNTSDECISRANEQGFSRIAMIKADSNVESSQMGALKGTLRISRTIYDIESHKVLKADSASAQVIGWSSEELDWMAAVDKAMRDLK